jgi:hypothetical protein
MVHSVGLHRRPKASACWPSPVVEMYQAGDTAWACPPAVTTHLVLTMVLPGQARRQGADGEVTKLSTTEGGLPAGQR